MKKYLVLLVFRLSPDEEWEFKTTVEGTASGLGVVECAIQNIHEDLSPERFPSIEDLEDCLVAAYVSSLE